MDRASVPVIVAVPLVITDVGPLIHSSVFDKCDVRARHPAAWLRWRRNLAAVSPMHRFRALGAGPSVAVDSIAADHRHAAQARPRPLAELKQKGALRISYSRLQFKERIKCGTGRVHIPYIKCCRTDDGFGELLEVSQRCERPAIAPQSSPASRVCRMNNTQNRVPSFRGIEQVAGHPAPAGDHQTPDAFPIQRAIPQATR